MPGGLNILSFVPRNGTRYGGVNIPDSGEWDSGVDASNKLEGMEGDVAFETAKTEAGPVSQTRQWFRRCRLVRNSGATTLQAGDAVEWTAAYVGRRVTKADTANARCAGVVIDTLPSTGCIQNDMCLIVTEGPNKCTKATGDGGITELAEVMTTAAGVVATVGTPGTNTEAFQFAARRVGIAMETVTTETKVLVYIGA